jgi:nitroreductase
MDILEIIRTRRSIRKYKPDPIPDSDLNIVLEAARWAPSWANTQCCRIIVVSNSDIKARIAETATEKNPGRTAILEAPIVLVVCAELKKSGYYKGVETTDKGDWYMFDVALATENLVLAAHSLGLGSLHMGLFDAAQVASLVNVPEGVTVVEMIPLGYPAAESNAPARKELTELVFYDEYGKAKV